MIFPNFFLQILENYFLILKLQKPGHKLNDFTDFVFENLENYFLMYKIARFYIYMVQVGNPKNEDI